MRIHAASGASGLPDADLVFFVASFAGYAMHGRSLLDVATFSHQLETGDQAQA